MNLTNPLDHRPEPVTVPVIFITRGIMKHRINPIKKMIYRIIAFFLGVTLFAVGMVLSVMSIMFMVFGGLLPHYAFLGFYAGCVIIMLSLMYLVKRRVLK